MTGLILIIIGAAITIIWGISHLFPTKSVVKGFGDITADNKNIIAMEWIVEGVSLIFIGIIVLCGFCISSLCRYINCSGYCVPFHWVSG
jgi:hypothetical protein